MRMYDLIQKKKSGKSLSGQEIEEMITGFIKGIIPDYQMSAMLMAIFFQGMTDEETTDLTISMANSGDIVDLSRIEGIKVDKHSTGGVGDKTTLIVAPIAAACGVKIAKMSGRGLGHTGGTVDKLEAIPGFQTTIEQEAFFHAVNQIGISVIGQTGNLAPADKLLYALRDVTATVDSIPLIASSIMSKKLAAGSDAILLDVKMGSGAFMKTLEDAILLGEKMTAIGNGAGKKCAALITSMNVPLGRAIGNSLEVIEALEILHGNGPEDLAAVCVELAANMIHLADKGDLETCRVLAKTTLKDGTAFQKFLQMIEIQGGDISVILDPNKFKKAKYESFLTAKNDGYITHMDTENWGMASTLLGAGRSQKEESIDYSAGILIQKKTGDYVQKGETIAILYASDENLFPPAKQKIQNAYQLESSKPAENQLIYAGITKDGLNYFEF